MDVWLLADLEELMEAPEHLLEILCRLGGELLLLGMSAHANRRRNVP